MAHESNEAASAKIACKRLGVSDETLRRWARTGKIKAFRTPGLQYRYDLKDFFERQGVIAASEEGP